VFHDSLIFQILIFL